MKKIILGLLTTALLGFNSVAYGEVGDLINIKLGGSPSYDNGAAINNVSGQYWNSYASTDQASWATLLYSDYGVSGASIQYNMTGTTGLDETGTAFPDGGIDTPLMRGFVSTDAYNTGTLTIQGLSAGEYEVYVYSQIDKDLTSKLNMDANGVSYSLTNNGSLTELTKGQNWVSHTVVVGDNGLLNMSFAKDSQINGIQIEAVPEPGTIVLLGVGSAFLLGFRRRKSEESAVNA